MSAGQGSAHPAAPPAREVFFKKRSKLSSQVRLSTARRTEPSLAPHLTPTWAPSHPLHCERRASASHHPAPPSSLHALRPRLRSSPYTAPLCAPTRALQPWPLRLASPHAARHRSRRTHAGAPDPAQCPKHPTAPPARRANNQARLSKMAAPPRKPRIRSPEAQKSLGKWPLSIRDL